MHIDQPDYRAVELAKAKIFIRIFSIYLNEMRHVKNAEHEFGIFGS
jgi:hypothetical protein